MALKRINKELTDLGRWVLPRSLIASFLPPLPKQYRSMDFLKTDCSLAVILLRHALQDLSAMTWYVPPPHTRTQPPWPGWGSWNILTCHVLTCYFSTVSLASDHHGTRTSTHRKSAGIQNFHPKTCAHAEICTGWESILGWCLLSGDSFPNRLSL